MPGKARAESHFLLWQPCLASETLKREDTKSDQRPLTSYAAVLWRPVLVRTAVTSKL
jgi:hypothetical protein